MRARGRNGAIDEIERVQELSNGVRGATKGARERTELQVVNGEARKGELREEEAWKLHLQVRRVSGT